MNFCRFPAVMSAFLYFVAAAVSSYVIVYYGVFRGASFPGSARLKGRTAIVTGNKPHLSSDPANMFASFIQLVHLHAKVTLTINNDVRSFSVLSISQKVS